MKKNIDLKKEYRVVYQTGADRFHTFSSVAEGKMIFDFLPSWEGLEVLEIGCGEGRLASMIGTCGAAHVDAIDYSQEAIATANRRFKLGNVTFRCADAHSVKRRYDVVVLAGVLEHLDDPFGELKSIIPRNLKRDGILIASTPSFLNPRGYVWMTLQLLFNVPMSLTDLHFLCPFDFQEFAAKNKLGIEIRSTNQDWGAGPRLIVDFKKRLCNALIDKGMDKSGVRRLLFWLEKAVKYFRTDEFSGQTVAYKLRRLGRGYN